MEKYFRPDYGRVELPGSPKERRIRLSACYQLVSIKQTPAASPRFFLREKLFCCALRIF